MIVCTRNPWLEPEFFQKKKKWPRNPKYQTLQTEIQTQERHLQQQIEQTGHEKLWNIYVFIPANRENSYYMQTAA